jgi:DNA-binding transcriptional MerR regulator
MTVRTLHHYEQTGLLTPSASEAGYRLYNLAAVQRLHMIKALAQAGLERSPQSRTISIGNAVAAELLTHR